MTAAAGRGHPGRVGRGGDGDGHGHGDERATSRRSFLLGAGGTIGLLLVGGCSAASERSAVTSAEAEGRARGLPPPEVPSLSEQTPKHLADDRVWLVAVPSEVRARARLLLPPELHRGVDAGLLALSEVCPSDRLELTRCASSAWFECPGCGSMFSTLGDELGGPADRGMWFHAVTVDAEGEVLVDPKRIDGLPTGTRLVDQPAAGVHCI